MLQLQQVSQLRMSANKGNVRSRLNISKMLQQIYLMMAEDIVGLLLKSTVPTIVRTNGGI